MHINACTNTKNICTCRVKIIAHLIGKDRIMALKTMESLQAAENLKMVIENPLDMLSSTLQMEKNEHILMQIV